MKSGYAQAIAALIAVGLIFLAGVCWHSVEEIHYLKSFFPRTFTVEESFQASIVELIKVSIIALPTVVTIAVGLYVLKNFGKR